MFAAGAIHAYLAADRKPPAIVAGISMGALNAAALQRCYQDLKSPPCGNAPADIAAREVSRWTWFRKYLTSLAEEPLGAIWSGVPRQSDFAADLPPVQDASVVDVGDKKTQPYWLAQEKLARRELYLFMKLGSWLAKLPLKVSDLADFLVARVRVKEKIGGWRARLKYVIYSPAGLLVPILWHVCFSPEWFNEREFQTKKYGDLRYFWLTYFIRRRPLFGWPVFLLAWAILLLVLIPSVGIAHVLYESADRFFQHKETLVHTLLLHYLFPSASFLSVLWIVKKLLPLVTAVLFLPISLAVAGGRKLAARFHVGGKPGESRFRKWILNRLSHSLFRGLQLEKAVVHNFHLRLRLARLFGERGKPPRLKSTPMPVVIVAAPLQTFTVNQGRRGVAQIWARKDVRLVDALVAALAVPGVFEPLHLEKPRKGKPSIRYDLDRWEVENPETALDLVDGSVIRENPLPALFQFLKKPNRESIARQLSSSRKDTRVHVIFSVPLDSRSSSLKPGPLGINIVDVLSTSLRLNRRRDTRLEIQQTNFMSELEHEYQELIRETNTPTREPQRSTGKTPRNLYPIFADSISPEKELTFKNPLNPDADEVLTMVADGCRRSLEQLYAKKLPNLAEINCHSFLVQIAPLRNVGPLSPDKPGLPEVCAHCTRKLKRPTVARELPKELNPLQNYPTLAGENPRIVFLASGGVFRGSFHAGMLACLLAADIRPDVIVGASVGTLMGGVLGAMLTAKNSQGQIDYRQSLQLLADLVHVLLHVDKDIAFTKTLKSAVRELGIRGRAIDLSPKEVRRMVKRGSRSDPGFAATGAPPALIDAISNLLFIPHRNTSSIAAQFVAGHVTHATKRLLDQMKTETLRRLDIEYSLMGVSLLEPTAHRLLGKEYGIPLDTRQPFQDDHIYFFGTTTNLLDESSLLLGQKLDKDPVSYDVVQAALASSAFPAVFAPRRASDVYPGAGPPSDLYSDGGMFDNLPFLPAIELLADVQRAHRSASGGARGSIEFLRKRHESPDLFIAGALNVPPESKEEGEGPFDDILTIARRAGSLKDNVKIRSFQDSADLIFREVEQLVKVDPNHPRLAQPHTAEVIDGIVEASVLPVYPVDREHLNPTYAFCASLGLREDRVQRSIVNGCFQTFAALADSQSSAPRDELQQAARSMKSLVPERIPRLEWAPSSEGFEKANRAKGLCPYFRSSLVRGGPRMPGEPSTSQHNTTVHQFVCPFWQADKPDKPWTRRLYEVCCSDETHRKEAENYYPPSWWETNLGKIRARFHKSA